MPEEGGHHKYQVAATDWLQLAPFRQRFAGQKAANCNQPQSHALMVLLLRG